MRLDLFLNTLPYVLVGMFGIFAVTGIIIVSIIVLNLVTSRIGKKKEQNNSQNQ